MHLPCISKKSINIIKLNIILFLKSTNTHIFWSWITLLVRYMHVNQMWSGQSTVHKALCITMAAESHPSPAGVWVTPTSSTKGERPPHRDAISLRISLSLSLCHMLHCQLTCGFYAHLRLHPNTSTLHTVPMYTFYIHVVWDYMFFSCDDEDCSVTVDESLILAVNRNFTGGSWTSTLYWCMQQKWVRKRWELGRTHVWSDPEFDYEPR